MDTESAARAWADAWERCWRALDAELLEPVYAPDAVQRSHPFRAPGNPIEYARWALGEEEGEPEVWMGDPIVTYFGLRRTTGRSDPAENYWVYYRTGRPCRTARRYGCTSST